MIWNSDKIVRPPHLQWYTTSLSMVWHSLKVHQNIGFHRIPPPFLVCCLMVRPLRCGFALCFILAPSARCRVRATVELLLPSTVATKNESVAFCFGRRTRELPRKSESLRRFASSLGVVRTCSFISSGRFLAVCFFARFFDMRMLFSASSMYTYMLLTVMFIVGSGPRRTRGFFWNENSAGKSRALTSCGQRTIQLVERWSPLPDVVVVINATYSLRTRQGLFGLGILVLV